MVPVLTEMMEFPQKSHVLTLTRRVRLLLPRASAALMVRALNPETCAALDFWSVSLIEPKSLLGDVSESVRDCIRAPQYLQWYSVVNVKLTGFLQFATIMRNRAVRSIPRACFAFPPIRFRPFGTLAGLRDWDGPLLIWPEFVNVDTPY